MKMLFLALRHLELLQLREQGVGQLGCQGLKSIQSLLGLDQER